MIYQDIKIALVGAEYNSRNLDLSVFEKIRDFYAVVKYGENGHEDYKILHVRNLVEDGSLILEHYSQQEGNTVYAGWKLSCKYDNISFGNYGRYIYDAERRQEDCKTAYNLNKDLVLFYNKIDLGEGSMSSPISPNSF